MKLNALNYFNLRKVSFAVPQFTYIKLHKISVFHVSKIDDWIAKNLKGRYYLNHNIELHIGFEIKNESTFFLISCPFIDK
jgi:hypothetical protein